MDNPVFFEARVTLSFADRRELYVATLWESRSAARKEANWMRRYFLKPGATIDGLLVPPRVKVETKVSKLPTKGNA